MFIFVFGYLKMVEIKYGLSFFHLVTPKGSNIYLAFYKNYFVSPNNKS